MCPLLVSVALAVEPPADAARVDVSRAVPAAGRTLHEGPLRVVLDEGTLAPIVVGDAAQPVGFVFSGQGSLTATFADRGDAWSFANRQVLLLGQPTAAWAAVAHQEAPFSCRVTRGVVSADAAFTAAFLAGEGVPAPEVDDKVSRHLMDLEALGAFGGAREGVPASSTMTMSFRCDQRLGYLATGRGESEPDHWIGIWRDRREADVPDALVALGHDAGGDPRRTTVGLAPWADRPRAPAQARVAWNGVHPIDVDAVVIANPGPRLDLAVQVEATYRFEATEALTRLTLSPPRSDRERFAVTALTVNGVALALPTLRADGTFDVPVQLARGATATLSLTTRDVWQMGTRTEAGASMRPRRLLANVNDGWFPYRVRVSLPQDSGLNVALSGETTAETIADGRHWVETQTDGRPTPVYAAFGEFSTVTAPSIQGLPQVRAHVFAADREALPSLPPFVRTVVAYYEAVLPPFPTAELEILQVPDNVGSFRWTALPGLVTLQQMRIYGDEGSVRSDLPHLEEAVMAHEIAHQWWGGLVDDARAEDAWMVETLAEVYMCAFVTAAFGPKDCEVRQRAWRKSWEVELDRTHVASLRRAAGTADWTAIAYDYGPYVFGHMLRGRIGDNAFFGALDAWARERSHNTATDRGLQAAFEATSGQDLSAFFDAWVESGFVPSLALAWDAHGATLSADVPFGIFEVPVALSYADGTQEVRWIRVVDGTGDATFEQAPAKVALDPEHLVLARKRTVKARR